MTGAFLPRDVFYLCLAPTSYLQGLSVELMVTYCQ
jgi:hypothetical protein